MDPIETEVFVGNVYGKMVAPNLTFMNTRFYGRPNFSGTPNDFNDDSSAVHGPDPGPSPGGAPAPRLQREAEQGQPGLPGQ
jgi:hypothetical protein